MDAAIGSIFYIQLGQATLDKLLTPLGISHIEQLNLFNDALHGTSIQLQQALDQINPQMREQVNHGLIQAARASFSSVMLVGAIIALIGAEVSLWLLKPSKFGR